MQTVQNKPVATTTAGSTWSAINSGLNDVLSVWRQVEEVKGAKAASGQDVIQARVVPELENGASVSLDNSLPQPKVKNVYNVFGLEVDKNIIHATGGLILLGLLSKRFVA